MRLFDDRLWTMLRASPDTYIVAIGGIDPSGGAGLVRDFVTAEALGATAVLVATAFTTQSSRGVVGFEPRTPAGLLAAIEDALGVAAGRPVAVKIGMVGEPALAGAIVAGLRAFDGPVVFDPVLAASSGGSLFRGDRAELGPLCARASLLTPNLAEAGLLTGLPVRTLEDARAAALQLRAAGAAAVLVKGGHLEGAAVDLLLSPTGERQFSAARLPGASPRGTGCALATALAIALAGGTPLEQAAAAAKDWLTERIRTARDVGGERRLG
jgi:hydroxymethylpyrimidine kinase/phosphomethylpyrimidine kinase